MVTCEVSRAPLVPSGSLTTWTRTSCPSFSRSSIFGLRPIARSRARDRRARRAALDAVAEPAGCGRSPPSAASARLPPRRADRLGDAPRTGRLVVLFVAGFEPLELLDGVDDFSDVEERVALEADVDEGGLHAGQHLRDPALVDVADDAALMLALDEDLDDLIVLEDRDARVVVARGDDHLLVHGTHSTVGRPRHTSGRRPRTQQQQGQRDPSAAIERWPEARGSCERNRRKTQLVNRRIRTLRMRPKAASDAISDEPP